jgi:hypothetical protein
VDPEVNPVSDAVALKFPSAADPPDAVENVARVGDVPHSNFGVVEVLPAEIDPESVAVSVPIADGVFVVTETAPT